MGLQEMKKELEEQLEAALEAENQQTEDETEDEAPEPEEDAPEEEKPVEEPKKEAEKPVEPEPDASAYARMRRDKAAAEKRIADLEAKLAQKEATPIEESVNTSVAVQQVDPEVAELLQERRITQAEREFITLESRFRAKAPDYDAVAAEYAKALAQSIRVQNPRMAADEVAEQTKQTLLYKASTYVNQGYDPIEELYEEAKALGFNGQSMVQKDEPEEEVERRPDLNKVAANRKRSAGMAGASGQSGSGAQLTLKSASTLTTGEWAKLTPAEKQRIMYGQ